MPASLQDHTNKIQKLWSLSKAPSHNKIIDLLSRSPKCREMIKPMVADSHLNNCYPACARRAIRVRTSAASWTPQHLLADSQWVWAQISWRQTISNHGIFISFFQQFAFKLGSARESRQAPDQPPFQGCTHQQGVAVERTVGLIAHIWISRR